MHASMPNFLDFFFLVINNFHGLLSLNMSNHGDLLLA